MSPRSNQQAAGGQSAPVVSRDEAAQLCERLFLTPDVVDVLDGYQDANFRVEDGSGRRFALKLSPAGRQTEAIRLERAALGYLETQDWPGVPRLIRSRGGRLLERVEHTSGELDVRLLTWIDGVVMAAVESASPALLCELGFYLGSLDLALQSVDFGEERRMGWDLARLDEQRGAVEFIESTEDRVLVENVVARFLTRHRALAARLPRSLIHHDANTHNVIVDSADAESARLVGLIDFGDLVVTETVHELAVAAAYVGFGREDPWRAARPLVIGYDKARSLNEAEVDLLFPAIQARLALSVLMAAKRRHEGTADAYALVSEDGAWEALRRLAVQSSEAAIDALRAALEEPGSLEDGPGTEPLIGPSGRVPREDSVR